jgi:NitT/TauT family transport system substrate-binding protein
VLKVLLQSPEGQAFRKALRETGWIEGQIFVFDVASAKGKHERLPTAAAKLAQRRPDVILALNTAPTIAVMQATSTIPIVMIAVGDAIGNLKTAKTLGLTVPPSLLLRGRSGDRVARPCRGEVAMSTVVSEDSRRRDFLKRSALAGAAGLLGVRSEPVAAEPPPETTSLKIAHFPSICVAPQYIVRELLRVEGFTDIDYVKVPTLAGLSRALESGEVDVSLNFVAPLVIQLDAGAPITLLGGVHVGCYQLFGTDRVRAIHDLKGKTVEIIELGSPQHVFLSSMLAHVGLDPRKDVNFVEHNAAEGKRLLAEGKIDAYLGFPPDPQELRARKIGHVVVNSAVDRPWSQYFCCIATGHREFVRQHPVATKRALRAILKAADICALEPERAAHALVDGGFTSRYDYALQTMKDVPYKTWRVYEPEDAVRFYALRLREAGMIKSTPQRLIAQGTDWRFLNELKKELKG